MPPPSLVTGFTCSASGNACPSLGGRQGLPYTSAIHARIV